MRTAFAPCHPGPGLCVLGAGELWAHAWLWFTWVSCGLGSWQATEAGHPRYSRCSETPWQMECCQQFHYTRYIAKECPKVPGKIILLLGKTAAWTQASPARGGTWVAALNWCCYILDGKWMWGNPGLLLRREASEKLSVHRASVRELKKEVKPKVWALCLKGRSTGSLYQDHPGRFFVLF